MKLSIDISQLTDYVTKQLGYFYPDQMPLKNDIATIMPSVMERLHFCFSSIHKKYFSENGVTIFHHLNSDHYAMFLYFLANEAYQKNYIHVAEKSFLLNKALHGIDAFYAIQLPEIFLWVHPVGTVLGNASYHDFLVVYQNVTVGTDVGNTYPILGNNVVLYAKSSIIGNCHVGHNVSIAGNALLRNKHVPDNNIVIGVSPNIIFKKNNKNNYLLFFGEE